jgi:hypothetical protein
VGIALAKFRLPIRDIKAAVLSMDESVLSLEMAKSLHNLKPTPEDRSTLSDFDGDVSTLGKVEQFFLEVLKYKLRELIVYKGSYVTVEKKYNDKGIEEYASVCAVVFCAPLHTNVVCLGDGGPPVRHAARGARLQAAV